MLQMVLENQSLRVGVPRGREALGSFLLCAPDLPRHAFRSGRDMRGGEGAFLLVEGVGCLYYAIL